MIARPTHATPDVGVSGKPAVTMSQPHMHIKRLRHAV